ncbi:hypothetical protein NQZ68_027000 [Dissostichus eleginoides]|nr:hypothetical protein NQZ68_027000 [Dissostichus eleginoides]
MEVKLFQSLEDRSINRGTGWGLAPDRSSLLAPSLVHRAPALQCISGQMPGDLDPGLVSNHQRVLALRVCGPPNTQGQEPSWSRLLVLMEPEFHHTLSKAGC